MVPLIEARRLAKHFPVSGGRWKRSRLLRAVDGVDFSIPAGETLGLVGESGSGKSTVGNLMVGLYAPTAGEVLFKGEKISGIRQHVPAGVRRHIQMVFQDPQSSLNPRMVVRRIVGYPLKVQGLAAGRALDRQVSTVLGEVGLSPEHMYRYPHEFSGGQRQRIGIARALVTAPEFIVFDEPTSALDVSVQAQILNLIRDLQRRYGHTYLFISHDLAVVKMLSHRIAVMYLGRIAESAPARQLFRNPLHPYTQALIASVPLPDPERRRDLAVLGGDIPSPVHLPRGCRFHPRCPQVMPCCRREDPPDITVQAGHSVACHLYSP